MLDTCLNLPSLTWCSRSTGSEEATSSCSSLSAVEWGRIQPHLESVELKLGATLYEMGDQIDWVVFPEQGLLSLISLMVSGRELETLRGRPRGRG